MPKRKIKIVVDADIARSAGETQHPVSSACRKALILIREHNHSLIACPLLRSEWKKHASAFAKKWLTSMIARKQVDFVDPPPVFSNALSALDFDHRLKTIALKDAHLVDAARAQGSFITSRDDNARSSIRCIQQLRELYQGIIWINPVTELEVLEDWLTKSKASTLNLGHL